MAGSRYKADQFIKAIRAAAGKMAAILCGEKKHIALCDKKINIVLCGKKSNIALYRKISHIALCLCVGLSVSLLTSCTALTTSESKYEDKMINNNKEEFKSENTILFRLAETMPIDHPSAKTMEYFADLVEERSEGSIQIKIYYDEALGSPDEILEQMKFGGIAMARVNSLELSDAVPSLRKYMMPEKYTGPGNQIEWFRVNAERLRNDCQLEKITPLIWYYPDLRCFYSSNNPIKSKNDLKNAKVKTNDCMVMKEIMTAMGAKAAVDVSSGMDTQRLLSSGDVQYGESGFCEFICRDFGKYIHYVRITDYAYFPDVLLINTDSLNGLAPEKKLILQECAEETYEYQRKQMLKFKRDWTKKLEDDDKVYFMEKEFH